MLNLPPPRHIPTLPKADVINTSALVNFIRTHNQRWPEPAIQAACVFAIFLAAVRSVFLDALSKL